MLRYTIKEIAALAGVTTRTLRYYDHIGLLPPAEIGANSYRYYNQDSLLKLQQILFYRELDVPLDEIQLLISRPDFNLESALRDHRARLQKRLERLNTLIATIDQTIANIKGDRVMAAQDYFEGFNESQYEEEVQSRWGDTRQYAESQRKWSSYSKGEKEAIKAEGGRITVAMVGKGPDTAPHDPDVQAAVAEYHAYINQYFYFCEVGYLRGLADMWLTDPRFSANYENVRPGGAAFVRDAVHFYCDHHG